MCSETNLEAITAAQALREHVDVQVGRDRELASRLAKLELLPGTNVNEEEDSHSAVKSFEPSNLKQLETGEPHHLYSSQANYSPPLTTSSTESFVIHTAQKNTPVQQTNFDAILHSSRVYSRVQDREVDAISMVPTMRSSRAWSILSGISMAQISLVAVIHLPLSDSELQRFRSLCSLANSATSASTPTLTSPWEKKSDIAARESKASLPDGSIQQQYAAAARQVDTTFTVEAPPNWTIRSGAVQRLHWELACLASETAMEGCSLSPSGQGGGYEDLVSVCQKTGTWMFTNRL